MRFTPRRIWLICFLALFLVPIGCLIGYHLHTRWAVERYQKQLRAKGEKLDLAGVLSSLPHPSQQRPDGLRLSCLAQGLG